MKELRPAKERAAAGGTQSPDPALTLHAARCGICRHPQRAELEQEFLDWVSPREIATEYKVSKSAIYHHAAVTGLLDQRRRNTMFALDRVIEQVGDAKVTSWSVISAIRLRLKLEAGRAKHSTS
jgi:hypothetical protein